MFEQTIIDAINTTLQSFDLTYCIVVNILTYLIIQRFDIDERVNNLNTWQKRLVFSIVCIFVAIVYYFTGNSIKVLFNSIILAPVSWSWLFKPICNKFNIDYNKDNKSK